MKKRKEKLSLSADSNQGPHSLGGIDDPMAVLSACLPGLRRQLEQSSLGFSKTDLADRTVRYALSGGEQQFGVARDRYPVHLLCQVGTSWYWVAIIVSFQFKNPSYRLVDAGIIVFEGQGFQQDKVPLLRAEWHCSEEQLRERHAQPHWHVYIPSQATSQRGFDPDRPLEFPSSSPEQMKDGGELEQMKFHFAMSALWQSGNPNAHTFPIESAKSLETWLCGCLGYVVGQLSALSERSLFT